MVIRILNEKERLEKNFEKHHMEGFVKESLVSDESFNGRLIRDIISGMTSFGQYGEQIKNGEWLKKSREPKWLCPFRFNWEIFDLGTFNVELVSPKEKQNDTAILQLHGGGYIGKINNIYRTFSCIYSNLSMGSDVLSADYRVAPDFPYPFALIDAINSYKWLLYRGYKKIIVVGDSAGGGLTLSLCNYLIDKGYTKPIGLILMSPWTDLTISGESIKYNYHQDPLFGESNSTLLYNKDYIAGANPTDPYLSPLYGDFVGFPPTLIQVGSYEMLLDDSTRVAEKAKIAGVDIKLSIYEGMFHNFQKAMWLTKSSRDAWSEIEGFMEALIKMKNN
ncbi:MAG TPA: alpha/beta hydrolase [Anaerovoracaceae bacterium]|nr:alpha/beta hydrolase [Anaerovoracaceae bacterium]